MRRLTFHMLGQVELSATVSRVRAAEIVEQWELVQRSDSVQMPEAVLELDAPVRHVALGACVAISEAPAEPSVRVDVEVLDRTLRFGKESSG